MRSAVFAAGILIQIVAWRSVVTRRSSFWRTTAATWALVGVAAVVAGDVRCCLETSVAVAVAVGAASGALLYAATRVVVGAAVRTAPELAPAVDGVYGRGREAPAIVVWAVTLVLVVPAEELFWRGLALPEVQRAVGTVPGAIVTWIASVAVAASWGSAAFLAAAVVGGGVWTGLAAWSGGIVAPLASHAVWTASMIAWRPTTPRAKVPS